MISTASTPGPQKVVVIDDSASSVAMMVRLLGTISDCEPIGFTDATKALAWCLNNDLDLIVVDYEMPTLNGTGFIEAFRREKRVVEVPVVMVTSTADKDVRYMALQIGATDFMTKPVDEVEFVARMRNLLTSYRAQKSLADVSQWLTDEIRKISMVVKQIPVSVVIMDRTGLIEYVNPKFSETSGYALEEIVGRHANIFKSDDMTANQNQELWSNLSAGNEWRGTFEHRRKDGSRYWATSLISPVRGNDGEITHFLEINEDITLRKHYEEQIAWQSQYDSLTGLPNRALALDRLGQALAQCERTGRKVATMAVDLDRFKLVNDTMGPAAGDELLRQVAKRLQSGLRQIDTVARMGSDEFVIILCDTDEPYATNRVAETICEHFRAPFILDGVEIFMSASIGIALYPTDGISPSDLLRNANAAVNAAKANGHGSWWFFTPELDAEARGRLTVESALRRALSKNEFEVHYHPLVDVATGAILGAEALLRWHSSELGPISPDRFIPIAEENGLIVPIGAWVIEQVCRDMAGWRQQGLPSIRVAINVSARQLADRSILQIIADALAGNEIVADQVELEVTERLLLNKSPDILAVLDELREMGLRFSIDDFGTGYSSMSYLTSFPFHVLKIDRSFVSRVTEKKPDAALARAMIAMAQSLDLEVVAEGVETTQQLQFLRESRCNMAQGYLFTKPLPVGKFVELLMNRTAFEM